MEKITQVIEAKSGGVFVIFDDGSAERLTRAEFKERAEEFKDVDGVASMLFAWNGEDDTAREARENRERCRRIAEDLEAAVRGGKVCPRCGEVVDGDSVEEVEREDEDGDEVIYYRCPECGEESPDEFEDYTIYDYLTDIYDTEYLIDGRGDYRAVRYMVACGGPNVWIDTDAGAVTLAWWGDRAKYPLSRNVVDAVDEIAAEAYEARRAGGGRW